MTDDEHVYDGAGICVLCNDCNDPGCCPDRPCTRRLIADLRWDTALSEQVRREIAQHHKGQIIRQPPHGAET